MLLRPGRNLVDFVVELAHEMHVFAVLRFCFIPPAISLGVAEGLVPLLPAH